MHKGDIAAALQARFPAYSLHRCEAIINAIFGEAADGGILATELCERGGKATITGFGTLQSVSRAQRTVVHPATKQLMIVPPQVSIRFRPSSQLRRNLRAITPG